MEKQLSRQFEEILKSVEFKRRSLLSLVVINGGILIKDFVCYLIKTLSKLCQRRIKVFKKGEASCVKS